MISLKNLTGLDVSFNPSTFKLAPENEVLLQNAPQKRLFSELQEYLKEELPTGMTKDPAYFIYRNIARKKDTDLFRTRRIRYDITIIPPRKIRHEYIKTAGHYHPTKPGTISYFPEVLDIISGHAYFILQKKDKENDSLLREIYLIEALPGEKVLLLPGFGHTTVNAFQEPLIFANLIGDNFSYDYEGFRKHHGAGYWLLEGNATEAMELEKNNSYQGVPEIKKIRPKESSKLGLTKKQPLYSLFITKPEIFSYLTSPENYTKDLTVEKCFKVLR